jgi:polysaccharide pyruvyl transferase WcaK-like protein
MLNLKIIGYYDHENLGDNQYKRSFCYLFQTYLKTDYTIDFYDCDKIKNINFKESDIIILGGGDILNNYFLDTIIKKFQNKNNKIIAVSVGIPYTQILIETNKLNIIDYIFLRTTIDIELLQKYFSTDKIFYLPDISHILSPTYNIPSKYHNPSQYKQSISKYITQKPINKHLKLWITHLKKIRLNKKIVCFALSRHIFNKDYVIEYNLIIKNLTKFISYLISQNYHILFINFNNNTINSNENDSIIASDVINNLESKNDITFINNALNYNDIISLFSLVDLCIPMRFHAVLFSIYCNIPFIPIYTTRKIHNLLLELNWDICYKLETNQIDIPTSLDYEMLIDKYTMLCDIQNKNSVQNIYNKLFNINIYKFDKYFSTSVNNFINILNNTQNSTIKDLTINKSIVDELIEKTYNHVQDFSKSQGYSDYRSITDDYLQNMITYIICYNLLDKSINTNYNYGLKQKIFNIDNDYDYNKEWRWMLNDYINTKSLLNSQTQPSNHLNLINIKYIDQNDYSGCHRSGWQYVYNYLEMLHNDSNDLIVDLYIDRTFHWNYDINKMLNIIPYRQSWVGFIHHTFDKTFSEYNCYNLLNCEEFIESLQTCKGLIVLSKYLKNQLELELKKKGLSVDIFDLTHPTDLNVIKFSYSNFYNNTNKKLIHIGGWLRNIYSFYNLTLPKTTTFKHGFLFGDKTNTPLKFVKQPIKKVALKGKNMTNYYPEKNFLNDLYKILNKNLSTNVSNKSFDLEKYIYIDTTSTITIKKTKKKHKRYGQQYITYPNCSTNHKTLPINQNCSSNNLNCIQENDDDQDNSSPVLNIDYSLSTGITNNWNKHFYEDMYKKINNVEYITFLENDDYDKLLSENIVFINLVDASAINTVLECIVRHTPIIVNRCPPVIELLGLSYPLYYNDDDEKTIEIYNLLKNDDLIKKAHKHLKNLNKHKYKIETFISNFIKIIKNKT